MAISGIDYKLFRDLRLLNALPLNSDVLELGEANWYGDVDLQVLRKDMVRFASEDHEDLSRQLDEVISARRRTQMWEIARIFWRVFIRPRTMTAIDFHGTELA